MFHIDDSPRRKRRVDIDVQEIVKGIIIVAAAVMDLRSNTRRT